MRKSIQRLKIILLVFIIVGTASAQSIPDSTTKKKSIFYKAEYGKNIIRYNPMATYFFEDWRNWAFGYERVLKNNQSISFNIGQLLMPVYFGDSATYTNVERKSESGFIFTVDYRYYLNRENFNPRPAPNGIYIGPFLSIYHTQSSTDFDYSNPSDPSLINPVYSTLKQNYNYAALGFQVGYQFIFWKRFALDMVIVGPSLAYYDMEMEIGGGLNDAEKEKLLNSSLGKFLAKSPVFNSLFENGDFSKSGRSSWFYGGWRYTFNLGYHF